MDDEAPVIYGLEFQSRALTAQKAELETVSFLVGTQSLKFDNQVHHLTYDEENHTVTKNVFLHTAGEVWHISASHKNPNLFATCFNKISPQGKCEMDSALWEIPTTLEDHVVSDDSSSYSPLTLLTTLDSSHHGSEVKSVIWHPCEGNQLVSLVDNKLLLWDINANGTEAKIVATGSADMKGKPQINAASWNPHQNCNIVAAAVDTSVRGWDLRTMQQSWVIESAHGQLVRELDFNPNRQYFLVTCGDDCHTKFWDIRSPGAPVLVQSHHSHWVWSVRFNHFHDQLVLSSSSDSRVVLSRVVSISSEPFGHLVEEEESLNGHEDNIKERNLEDGIIATYEEHEDSVYAAEWSSVDPWLFASLSYDGRLVLNKVPRAEKYRILL
ncbi:EARP-interacting protein homolog [Tachypleus tridentatus]|uniref:EARP-interacting protein homolog n=1 Tax=Tachypleus tridentatus TaxID=6853 RepID=UPI003FD4687B